MKRSGFSLLELLIVTALLPVLSFAVFANFNSGIKLWQAIVDSAGEEDVLIFYEKAGEDLSGSFRYGEVPVEGTESSFTFTARASVPAALGGDRGIAITRYFYDQGEGAIKRETRNLNQVFKKQPGTIQALLRNVGSCRFRYLYENKDYKTFEWVSEWNDPKQLPVAVRFTFVHMSPKGSSEIERTFRLPAGGVS